jgi:hypothetical protein
MKKLVATAAVAAMLGSAAFAEISFGSWCRSVTVLGNGINEQKDGNDIILANTQSWGGTGSRVGLAVNGKNEDETLGFNFEIHSESPEFTSQYVWWAPIEQVKLQVGLDAGNDTLRGDACFGMWDLLRIGAVKDGKKFGLGEFGHGSEGWTFQNQGADGAVLGIFPIEGLKLYASLGMPHTNRTFDDDGEITSIEKYNAANVVGRYSKYAVGYDIEGVGTIKVGLDTTPDRVDVKDGDATKKKDQNIINAAFDLKAVEGLYVGIGAFIPTVQKIDATETALGNRVNAYARYNADALTVHARVGTVIGTGYKDKDGVGKKDGGFGFLVGGCVEYAVLDGLTVYGQADYANGIWWNRSEQDNQDVLDFGVGAKKDFAGGWVSLGFEGATNDNGQFSVYETGKGFSWAVPLVINFGL